MLFFFNRPERKGIGYQTRKCFYKGRRSKYRRWYTVVYHTRASFNSNWRVDMHAYTKNIKDRLEIFLSITHTGEQNVKIATNQYLIFSDRHSSKLMENYGKFEYFFW